MSQTNRALTQRSVTIAAPPASQPNVVPVPLNGVIAPPHEQRRDNASPPRRQPIAPATEFESAGRYDHRHAQSLGDGRRRRRRSALATRLGAGLARHPPALSRLDAGPVLADHFHRRDGRRRWASSIPTLFKHRRAGLPAVPGAVAGALGLPGVAGVGSLHRVHRRRGRDPLGSHAVLRVLAAGADPQRHGAGAQHRGHRRGVRDLRDVAGLRRRCWRCPACCCGSSMRWR